MLIHRRLLLAAGGTVAAGLAAGKLLRDQPLAATDDRKTPLRDLSSLVPTDPPKPAAAISFKDAQGKTLTLADYAGQGIVLNLWATWCVPCISELPALDAAAPKLKADRIAVLPLSSDHGGAAVVEKYFSQHGITHLPVLLDPEGAAMHMIKVRGIPTTLIIDRQGREQARFEGAGDWASDKSIETIRKLVG